MRKTDIFVPENILSVLASANVLEDRVILTGQLDRQTYMDTAAVLDRIGGKWNKKEKAHTFTREDDVRALVAEMLDTKEMPKAGNKNPLAYFATRDDIADQVVEWSKPTPALSYLEPSCGEGAILRGLRRAGVHSDQITAFESDANRAAKSTADGFSVSKADFLACEVAPAHFDRVVMNPPFAVAGDATAYITHINHAFSMLARKGVLISIAPSSLLYRTDKRTSTLRDACEDIEKLPEDAFKESGTLVSTVMLRMVK